MEEQRQFQRYTYTIIVEPDQTNIPDWYYAVIYKGQTIAFGHTASRDAALNYATQAVSNLGTPRMRDDIMRENATREM